MSFLHFLFVQGDTVTEGLGVKWDSFFIDRMEGMQALSEIDHCSNFRTAHG